MKTICVIDDDPIQIFVTEKLLGSENICKEILVFGNGKEAFDGLQKLSESGGGLPDVILLDLNMPVWDGWDFLEAFGQIDHPKKVAIFIVTSSNNPSDINKAKRFKEVLSFITKPLAKEKLITEIQSVA